MSPNEQKYLNLLNEVYRTGEWRNDRTGTGVRSLFGKQVTYNLEEGFPLLTTKRVHWKSIVHELLWFLKGDTNVKYLQGKGVKIWDAWADLFGELGPVYGAQWRFWGQRADHPGIDQISELINGIKKKPNSRRHIVSAWNPTDIPSMALPPCHCFFQIYVTRNMTLDMQIYQRSADIFLGVPFNIASYALLLMMISHVTGYKAGRLLHVLGDVHLYSNHEQQALQQLQRVTLPPKETPVVKLNSCIENIFDFGFNDITLEDYEPYNSINAPVAV